MSNSVYPIPAILLVALVWPQTSTAATLVITDKAAWETEVLARTYAFNTENFDDSSLNSDLAYTTGEGGVYEPELGAGDDDGLWRDRVAQPNDPNPEISTTFEIAQGSHAIGGNWDLSLAGEGTHILMQLLDAAGSEIASHEIPYLRGEFWGIISDEKFSSMRLSAYPSTDERYQETYYLEDMVYSRGTPHPRNAATTPVPLPAAFWLFTSGLLGLMGIGRWRRNSLIPTGATSNASKRG